METTVKATNEWRARRKDGSLYAEVVLGDGPALIAEVYNHEPGAFENATLMAAAPQLANELQEVCDFLTTVIAGTQSQERERQRRIYKALDVLAKARGQS